MKIWFDTEFLDLGDRVELLSLGAIREDGAVYYAERGECNVLEANDWVQHNVIPHLTGPVISEESMRQSFREFVGVKPEFWAYYATYDAMLLFKLYGGFMQFPWNQVIHDICTLALLHDVRTQPMQKTTEHNALNDARWNKELYEHIIKECNRPRFINAG